MHCCCCCVCYQTILVARTDAEAATLLDSNIDPRDHPFILGATRPGTRQATSHVPSPPLAPT